MKKLSLLNRLFPKAEHIPYYDSGDKIVLPKKALPFVWYFVSKVKLPLLINLFLYGTGTVLLMLEPYFFGRMVDVFTINTFEDALTLVVPVIIAYIVLVQILSRLCYHIGHILSSYSLPFLPMLMRQELSIYLQKHSYRYFQEDYAGRLAGKVIEMPQAVREFVQDILMPIQFVSIAALTSIAIFFSINWIFGVVIAFYFVITIFNLKYFVPKILVVGEQVAEKTQIMRGQYLDNISNIFLIKLFSRQSYENKRFLKSMSTTCNAQQDEIKRNVYFFRAQHVISGIFLIGVVLLCYFGFKHQLISIGEIATVLPLSSLIISHVWWIMEIIAGFISKITMIEDALDTIVVEHEVMDNPNAKILKAKNASIEFDKVDFSYNKRVKVFKDFSFRIDAHKKIGIVGNSGGGKTSLVSLLLRLYDIQEGTIKIGGTDISTVTLDSLREHMTVIPQHTDLFHRSIRENIAYGKLNATDAEIIAAAKRAHAHDFIMEIEDGQGNKGYDAQVGERGVKLSGGQRQRVAIARAILKDAPLLILDEATSALDSESEASIQASLKELMKGKTVIAIAHRLSTLSMMDEVIVLDKGRIAERGKHNELLKRKGHYAKLWNIQSGKVKK